MLFSVLDHSRQAKYIKWKRKNKQAGDYIPIKILAAHIVIDMAEILEICEGKQNLCMNINTRTHTQFLEWCRSALSKQHIHPPRRSVAGFVGGLFTAHYPLCCYKIKALKLPMGHTEPSCVTEAAVCTLCILRHCDISKYAQQAHAHELAATAKNTKLHIKYLRA